MHDIVVISGIAILFVATTRQEIWHIAQSCQSCKSCPCIRTVAKSLAGICFWLGWVNDYLHCHLKYINSHPPVGTPKRQEVEAPQSNDDFFVQAVDVGTFGGLQKLAK